ncbi:MAG: CaiB/BaiF CoA transferase family protein [Dehalococcoidia bacterium]
MDLADEKGALCTKILADLGADVIKIEKPEGDETRNIGPFKGGLPDRERSFRFASLNVNKRGITLNLEADTGKEIFKRLVADADIVVESFPPGYLEGLGLGYNTLSAVSPGIVLTSITGFGQTGPYKDYKANDLVAFAMGGLLYICGDPQKAPCVAPETQAYYMACLEAALGTLIALFLRRFSGRGQHVDISMQDCLATQEHLLSRYSDDGHIVRRAGSQHAMATPGAIYRCKDGYVHFFVVNEWDSFVDWIGAPEVFKEKIWQAKQFRRDNVDVINHYVQEFTAQKSKDALVEEAQARHIPCTAVQSVAEAAEDRNLNARRFFPRVKHPDLGVSKYVGFPFRLSRTPCRARHPAPLLGQHNFEIYGGELGLSPEELSALSGGGVI